ncbi:hypothetical protein STRNI_001871 [Streptomyces nigrescens]|uniref:Uncharacterized protein n=1 Tax=Streptomyces nigrescens TaxID=1920 RepID=A0ABY7IXJ8_STRNI|nr:hypothetical protein STRNI_001871 [Streptomyces nigrescens]
MRVHLSQADLAQPINPRPRSPRTVAGWILRHPDNLPEAERLQLKAVLAHCPELDALTIAAPSRR